MTLAVSGALGRCALPVLASLASLLAACNPGDGEGAAPRVVEGAPAPAQPAADGGSGGAAEYVPGGGGDVFVAPDGELPGPPDDSPPPVFSRGLKQRQVTCAGGASTSLSGTVYIPSGALPVYNAVVYVPDATLAPLTPGASCSCEISGAPLVSALTDAEGRFVLTDVPVGANVPLVVQVGDWRREFTIESVAECVDNPVPDQTLRLPSRQSEGDLPRIAVATGQIDALECLVRKLGVDISEFTPPEGGGRVHLYAGQRGAAFYEEELNGGATFPVASELWASTASLSEYDVVLLSCGGRDDGEDKGEAAYQAMYEYLNAGGRMFASHYQAIWFERGPAPFSEVAEFSEGEDLGNVSVEVITSFPKGAALQSWLAGTGQSERPGEVDIRSAERYILRENPAYAQRWLATSDQETVQYMSANTPLGASDADQCGRVVLSDIHVSPGDEGDDISYFTDPFPSGCISAGFTPQEAVLAFMLFDISACIVPDSQAPVPPPIIR